MKDKKVMICSVHPQFDNRIQKHIRTLLKNDCELIYLNASDVGELDEDIKDKISLFHLQKKCHPKKNFFSYLHILFFMIPKIFRIKASLVHLHDIWLLPLALIAKLTGKRVVYDRHENYELTDGYVFFSKIYEKLFRIFIDGYIFVTDYQAHYIRDNIVRNKFKFKIVPNYQSIEYYKKIEVEDRNYVRIVYFGSLMEYDRDIETMFYVFEFLLKKEENIQVFVGGKDYSEETLKKMKTLQYKFNNRFFFYKNLPYIEVAKILKNSDIGVVFPKKKRTVLKVSTNKIFEYLTCGLVVITRKDFDISEIIENEGAGKAFKYETDKMDIASYIYKIIKDKEKLREMKNKSKKIGSRYTWENIEKRYIDLYKSILR